MGKRIALCISGQMRTYKKCYGYLYENILKPFNPDIFISTWRNSGSTTKLNDDGLFEEETIEEETLEKLYDPIKVDIEKFEEKWYSRKNGVKVPEAIKEVTNHWKGNIPMFYKINKCNSLKKHQENKNGKKYDIVIKIRPDLIVPNEIPEKIIEKKNILWHSDSTINPTNKVSDKFALSSSQNMDYYSSVWDKLEKYWRNPLGRGINESIRVGERLMYHHMSQSDIKTHTFSIGCRILRSKIPSYGQEKVSLGTLKKCTKSYIKGVLYNLKKRLL